MARQWHRWFTPRLSGNAGNCVETYLADDAVHVRNSRDPHAVTVIFTHDEWRAFIDSVKTGDDYDLPG